MPTLIHNPRCSKSRQAKELLDKAGVKYDVVEYLKNPLGKNELQDLLKKLGLKPHEVLRTKEIEYKGLGLDKPGVSDERILDALVSNPVLLERPIFVKGNQAVIGRPTERIKELL